MIKVQIRTARNMKEVQEAYGVAAVVFGPNHSEAVQRKAHILTIDDVSCPEDVIIALDKEKIVGMARIIRRKNYFLASLLNSSGLTSVCVLPKYRGKGVGSAMIDAALVQISREGLALSIVIARRAADGFYPQFGYVGTGLFIELTIDRMVCSEFEDKHRINYKTGPKSAFIKKYAEMYAKTYHSVPLAFYRSFDWWNNIKQNLKYKIKEEEFVNVIYKNTLVGYFIHRENKVIEAACFSKYSDIFCQAILQYLDIKLRKRFSNISIAISGEHACLKYYRRLNSTIKTRNVWNGGHLIRIMDKAKIKKLILSFINKRCLEFCEAERARARKKIRRIFDMGDSKTGKIASRGILNILYEKDSPVIKKIARNLQHTWSALDEF